MVLDTGSQDVARMAEATVAVVRSCYLWKYYGLKEETAAFIIFAIVCIRGLHMAKCIKSSFPQISFARLLFGSTLNREVQGIRLAPGFPRFRQSISVHGGDYCNPSVNIVLW